MKEKKLCIAHAGDLSRPSGGTDRVTAFAAGLQEQGVDVTLVLPRPVDTFPERLQEVTKITVPVDEKGVRNQLARGYLISRCANRIATNNNALLQIEHSTLAGVASLCGSSNYVLDMHDLAYPSPLYGDLRLGNLVQLSVHHIEGRGLREASHILAVSNQMRDFAANEWKIPREKFTIVPNGYFQQKVDAHRHIKPIDNRVVFLGTLHPKLDLKTFIMIARSPAVDELTVIGDGPLRDDLESARARLGLSSLRLTGKLPNEKAFDLLASGSVAINPQHASLLQKASSPVKLYYYAAFGCPMVLSSGPEMASQLAASNAASIVDPGEEFAPEVERLLADEEQRKVMARNARNMVTDSTWQHRVHTVMETYTEEVGI